MTGPTYGFGFWSVPEVAPWLLVAWGAFCLFLAVRQKHTGLVIAIVLAGVVQWPLIAFIGNLQLQLTTDIAAIALVISAAWARRRFWLRPVVLLPVAAVVLFLVLQAARAGDPVGGVLALRQVLYPLAFVGVGATLRDEIDWRLLSRVLFGLVGLVFAYMAAETVYGGPILDPTPTEIALAGGFSDSLRYGLPFAYVSDGSGGVPYLRAGGPFFNPPIAGVFLGVGVYAALRWLNRPWGVAALVLGSAACAFAAARGGLLMIAVVVAVPLAVRLLGRWSALVVGGVLAAGAASVLAAQGNTASHAQGLVEGVRYALQHPLGAGIGNQGFFAQQGGGPATSGEVITESWLGVVVAGTGALGLLAAAVLLTRAGLRVWRQHTELGLRTVYPLGVLAVAALTESAAALRGTPAMWLLLGEAVALPGAWLVTRTQRAWPTADVLWVVRDASFAGGAERIALALATCFDTTRAVTVVSTESKPERRDGCLELREGLPFPDLDLLTPLQLFPLEGALGLVARRRIVRRALASRLAELIAASPDAVAVLNHNAVVRGCVRAQDRERVVVHLHASVRQLQDELRAKGSGGLRDRLRARGRRRDAKALLELLRTCGAVVVTNPGEQQPLAELLERPVEAILNPLPWPLRPVDAVERVVPGRLLFVGRLAPEKRPDLVLAVIEELQRRGRDVDPRLLGDGPLRPALETEAERLGLDLEDALPGAHPVDARTYGAGEVLLLPSDYEAFPTVLLEAASQGVPCVATDVSPGVSWIAEHAGSVALVAAGDVTAMADAVERFWSEPASAGTQRLQRGWSGLQDLQPERVLPQWRQLVGSVGTQRP